MPPALRQLRVLPEAIAAAKARLNQEVSMSYFRAATARRWEQLEVALAHRKRHPHPNPPPGPVAPVNPLVTVRFLNRSTVVSDAAIAAALTDLQTQVSHDFAPAWLFDAELVAGGPPAGPNPSEWIVSIEDDATVSGALGFHVELDGAPTAHVFARTIQRFAATAQAAGNHPPTWASVASHELLEMLGDPRTVLAGVDDPTGTGRSGTIYMAEACDAVEQSVYQVGNTEVSDFVLPAWWDRMSAGPFDHLGLIDEPFQLEPGGSYIGLIRFTSQSGWEQKTAQTAPDKTTSI